MAASKEPRNPVGHESLISRLDWPIIAFFVLAYLIAWSMIPLLDLIAQQSGIPDWIALNGMAETLSFNGVDLSVPGWLVYLITRVQDFAFSIAGVIMIAYLYGRDGLQELGRRLIKWRVGWRWWLAAFIPFGLYLIAAAVAGALGTLTFSMDTLYAILFSAQAGFLVTLLLRGPMGEELGLRGFALPRMQGYMSPFRASVIIGILWAGWHLPVLLGRDIVSIVAFLLLAFFLSFIFTWLFNGSGGSLLTVLVFHACQNSEEVFEAIFPGLAGTDWELVSTLGLLIIGIVVAIWMWRSGRYPSVTLSG
ncbi:MAG: CPBP family intramembrane glutamic endopeptidase [Candidatus Promineifilaceae bacterium]|nr:CPBP family intramembrane glutamic endopeptidase [Candidatus Promineifilaceae bacterium]